MRYSDKLRDPRWQKKRLEVMQRDDFTCLACGDTDSTLNCHHKEYHGDPWDAPMDSLETLCEECHGRRTRFNKHVMSLPSRLCQALEGFTIISNDNLGRLYNIYCLNHELIHEKTRNNAAIYKELIDEFSVDWEAK